MKGKKDPFSKPIRIAVFKRQRGMCAFCGENLNELLEETAMNWIEFHHVQPEHSRGLSDEDNCVAVCTYTSSKSKDGCHYHIHELGRFTKGAVAPPEDFKHSHAHESAQHEAWVQRWRAKYGYLKGEKMTQRGDRSGRR